MDRGRVPIDQLAIQNGLDGMSLGANAALTELTELKKAFDNILILKDYSQISFVNYHFSTRPAIVASGCVNPTHDLHARRIQDLSEISVRSHHLIFSILPEADGFWASFLWSRKDTIIPSFVRGLNELGPTVGAIHGAALTFTGNAYLRPSFWQNLSSEQKGVYRSLSFMGVLNDDYSLLPSAISALSRNHSLVADHVGASDAVSA
jgi:hypothetical protein